MRLLLIILPIILLGSPWGQLGASEVAPVHDGYRGLWYQLRNKYSGAMATYTAKHRPLAVYAEAVDRTFFVYGGTTAVDERELVAMIGVYDHATRSFAQPREVMRKPGVDDGHDNPSLAILADGRLLVAVSGRNTRRKGVYFRSLRPYDPTAFERVPGPSFTYPQPWVLDDGRLVHCFTRYTGGREIYVATANAAAEDWTDPLKLVGFGGHYQVSAARGDLVVTAFNWHPKGNVDARTNLYVMASSDAGRRWMSLDGGALELPLKHPDNPALVRDFAAEGLRIYLKDIALDDRGRPAILVVAAPAGAGPRRWLVARFNGRAWDWSQVTTSDHSYDTGCLWLDGDTAWVVGPSLPGPQPNRTGGDLEMFRGQRGRWTRVERLTTDPTAHHSYVRRPLHARPDFAAFWGSAVSDTFSPVRLHALDLDRSEVVTLPMVMPTETAARDPFKP
ncbi:MAG: BNR-4 repeat-containing protein [Planctomycetota bacterium]|jgi:hypothetical protein|nr:BNR-4 repeat-containing protein [Planctomycetota bacterium]